MARCVDEVEITSILEKYHDNHGQFGGKMLLAQLIRRFYLPTRAKDTVYYARTCRNCQRLGPLQPSTGIWPIVHLQPMDVLGMDVIRPIAPVTSAGNRYIVILVDYFTRYMFANAVTHATGEAAKNLLENVTDLLGWPLSIYTVGPQNRVGTWKAKLGVDSMYFPFVRDEWLCFVFFCFL